MSTLHDIAGRIGDRSQQVFSDSPSLILDLLLEGEQLREEIQQIRILLLSRTDELLRQQIVLSAEEEPLTKASILNLTAK